MAKKSPKPQEIKAEYHLVNSNDSRAKLIFLPPDECALYKGTVVAAGSFEAVKAAANLLAPNNYKIEKCITPTGLINKHFSHVKFSAEDDKIRCAFCGESFND